MIRKLSLLQTIFLSCAGILLIAAAVYGQSHYYVDASRADDTGDGSGWLTAKRYLQSALALASSDAHIYVAQGTYYPDEGDGQTDNVRTSTFQMKSTVDMYGGYSAGGGTRDISTYTTTLSGDLDKSGTHTTNDAYHVVSGVSNATIDGFTITGGYAYGGTGDQSYGGGMFNDGDSPTISNCTFTGNYANKGGGLYNYNYSLPTISNCTFSSNETSINGYGGGMANLSYSSMTVSNCSFSSNTATTGGGGLYSYSNSTTSLTGCTFTSNSATQNGAIGGAVEHGNGSPVWTDCVFISNTATSGYGGAVYTTICSASLTNCVFRSNSATTGGAIRLHFNDTPSLTNCTFSSNSASADGDGISGNGSTFKNCILWGSNDQINGTATATYSDIQQASGTYTGTGNINSDPLFVSGSDLHLTDYSPCIGTGTATGAPATDIEGSARGTPPDMGAYENARDVSLAVTAVTVTATVQGRSVILEWATENETDNIGFIIERAEASVPFETIASWRTHNALKGAGNTSSRTEYMFTDETVENGGRFTYRISDEDIAGKRTELISLDVTVDALPQATELLPAYPNPFNPETKISYNLAEDGEVSLVVMNLLGRTVAHLILSENRPAGSYHIFWDGTSDDGLKVPSGTYMAVLKAGKLSQTRKVTLIR